MNKFFENKFICAKCRKILDIDELQYVCRNKAVKHDTDDKPADSYESITGDKATAGSLYYFTQPQLKGFLKTSGKFSRCPCCKKGTKEVVCPDCKRPISIAARRETISITGVKSSGKTVYIASMIKELQDFFDRRGVTCRIDANYMEDYSKYYNFRVGQPLPGGTTKGVKDPIILHIAPGESDALDLIIYDIAGESLVASDNNDVDEDFRHLALSSMIVYLFDPLQGGHINSHDEKIKKLKQAHKNIISNPTKDAKGKVVSSGDIYDYQHSDRAIISFMTENIEKIIELECQTELKGRLPIKIAPTISLIDTIKHLYDGDDNYFCAPVDYTDGTPAGMQKKVNKSVKKLLKTDWGESLVEFDKYDDVAYFGVSSLGCPPAANNTLPETYTPINVINPIIWLLERNGTLPKRRKTED